MGDLDIGENNQEKVQQYHIVLAMQLYHSHACRDELNFELKNFFKKFFMMEMNHKLGTIEI